MSAVVAPAAVRPVAPRRGGRSVADVLGRARATLRRLAPVEAAAAVAAGGLLVDIRPAAQRAEEGEVPGALVVERNVLEWRLEPGGEAALPVADADLHVVVLCSEGYTSSLAAAALQELGVHRATDVAGGFRAWAAAGLPTTGGPVRTLPADRVRDQVSHH